MNASPQGPGSSESSLPDLWAYIGGSEAFLQVQPQRLACRRRAGKKNLQGLQSSGGGELDGEKSEAAYLKDRSWK